MTGNLFASRFICFTGFLLSTATSLLFAQKNTAPLAYEYNIDLNKTANDEVNVDLKVAKGFCKPEVIFHMPRIIPGTYRVMDFGRFVKGFTALDNKGNKLEVLHSDINTWVINNAEKLDKINYFVEDTWESPQQSTVFEPAGTRIASDSIYLINHQGFFGFFEDMLNYPVDITVIKPMELRSATTLERLSQTPTIDVFHAANYRTLIDNPIFYSMMDTTVFNIGNTKVTLLLCDKKNTITTKDVVDQLYPLLQCIRQYLGGRLPLDYYTFIIYVSPKPYKSKSYGALEHSHSTMLCLQQDDAKKLIKNIQLVAAHEFFHVLTPLTIHSNDIEDFNFINPSMSEHLWFYEGIVEYMSNQVQVKYGQMTPNEFFDALTTKLRFMAIFDNTPLLELSKHCLEDKYRKQYLNIYHRGAITALCLDLLLLKSSKGKYSVVSLLNDLMKTYGPGKPFKDEELFAKITALTYPQVGVFLNRYVADTTALPFTAMLADAGIKYFAVGKKKDISPLGGLENNALKPDGKGHYVVEDTTKLDDFGKTALGFQQRDTLYSWNGQELNAKNTYGILLHYADHVQQGDQLEVGVIRGDKHIILKATIQPVFVKADNIFEFNDDATIDQIQLGKAWLGSGARF